MGINPHTELEFAYDQLADAFVSVGRMLGGLGDRGPDVIRRLKVDPGFVERVQQVMRLGGLCESSEHQHAREIFEGPHNERPHFWGVAEWDKRFDTCAYENFSYIPPFSWRGSWIDFFACPFHEGKELAETFFCFLSTDRLGDVDTENKHGKVFDLGVMQRVLAAKDSGPQIRITERAGELIDVKKHITPTHWQVISINPVPGSHNRTFADQQKLLPNKFSPPHQAHGSVNFAVPELFEFVMSRVLMMLRSVPFQRDIVSRVNSGYEHELGVRCTRDDVVEIDVLSKDWRDPKCFIHATLEPPVEHEIMAEYLD